MRQLQILGLICAALLAPQALADGEWLAPIPGMFTARGVDGSLFGRGYDPILGEVKAPILDFHYNGYDGDSNVWRDPETGISYKRPDEVIVFDNSASSSTTDLTVFESFEQYASFEESMHSTSFGFIVFAYSESDVSGYVREIFAANESIVMLSNRLSTQYQLQTRWGPDILKYLMQDGRNQSHTAIAQAQQLLPKSRTTQAEVEAYQTFIDRFGTHYVDGAFFGGSLNCLLIVDRSTVQKHTESWSEKMSGFAFDIIYVAFGFMHGKGHSKSQIDNDFQEHSTMTLIAYGGDTTLIDQGNYSHWQPSVSVNPAPVNSTYVPISQLIIDPTRAALLQQACDEYLKTKPAPRPKCGSAPGTNTTIAKLPEPSQTLEEASKPKPDTRVPSVAEKYPKAVAAAERVKATQYSERQRRLVAQGAPQTLHGRVLDDMSVEMRVEVDESGVGADVAGVEGAFWPPIPGWNAGIGKGYDVLTGDSRLSVADISYSGNKTWLDPFSHFPYSIPDALDFTNTPSACFLETDTVIMNSSAAWEAEASMTGFFIGIGYDGFNIGIGFNKEMAHMQALTKNYSLGLSYTDRSMGIYHLDFGSGVPKLDANFQAMLDHLPNTPSPLYSELIQYWGSHYVASASFGGYCNFTVLFEQTMVAKESVKWVSEQISLSVGYMMGSIGINFDFGFDISKTTAKINEHFKQASNMTYSCVGGDVALILAKEYEAWSYSVHASPGMIPHSLALRPISALIFDPTKVALLNDAIKAYVAGKPYPPSEEHGYLTDE